MGENSQPLKVRLKGHQMAVFKRKAMASGIVDYVLMAKIGHYHLWNEIFDKKNSGHLGV